LENEMRVAAEDYRSFINGLSGLIDDAEEAGLDASGILSMQEAKRFFLSDLAELYPDDSGNAA
jgi:hypothetical protein